mmetsp:Transcript_26780/g.25637  ORF Transcript_26780/g.25637 Transcript_26780/m.25637 type:complete len:148 (-) Transcript_26780:440-883(-)
MLCNFRIKSAMDQNEGNRSPVGDDHAQNGLPEVTDGMNSREEEPVESRPSHSVDPAGSTGIESGGSREVMGSAHLRPVFLGNLSHDVHASDVADIFERPLINLGEGARVPVDRIDLKRGFCFVFLKPAASQTDKDNAERYVSEMNGM